MFCMNCGKEVPEGSAFCPACGTRVGEVPKAQQHGAKGAAQTASRLVGRAADTINEMTGGTGHVDLRVRNLVDAVFKKHDRGEADELFACGTPATTPALKDVSSEWPHPWLYSRVFLVLLAAFVGMYFIFYFTANTNVLPGLMFLGALMVPFAVVVLLFETNALRNISLPRVIEMFFAGGVLSLVVTIFLFGVVPGTGTGDLVPSVLTGVVEELGKAAAVAYLLSKTKGRNFILSGILIGAAVGAGFAVFETAGYIFNSFMTYVMAIMQYVVNQGISADISEVIQYGMTAGYQVGFDGMMDTLVARAVLAIGGHVAWAAVEGGALALCDEGKGFSTRHLTDARFLFYLVACIVLHGIWDMTIVQLDVTLAVIPIIGSPKYLLLIVGVWVLLLVLLNRGFAQVNTLAAEDNDGAAPAVASASDAVERS